MKRKTYLFTLGAAILLSSCHDLNLDPLSEGSTETWYSTESEIEMAVNALYGTGFWIQDGETRYDWSDDCVYQQRLSDFESATVNGQNAYVGNLWTTEYKAISRANSIILKYQRAIDNGASKTNVMRLVGEARFMRAYAYYKLIFKFGDVPLVENDIDISQGLSMGRTDKSVILKKIYEDFDAAASVLPISYSGEQRATKGAALALKARVALYMGDWAIAAEAAKAVIDLGTYKLHSNYSDLFLQSTKTSPEFVFIIPRSIAYSGNYLDPAIARNALFRNIGGWGGTDPSWDLLASYTCTDGLPIDESPLFDSHNPFKNRDPRCSMTILPFGENFLGYEYNPSPEAVQIMNYNTGKMIVNHDSQINDIHASINGLVWKKGIDKSWTENGFKIAPPKIICRYADVLLMYAEAKIELNQIDQSVLDAMNTVRARAYGVDKTATNKYPAFTSTNQKTLRSQLRIERRMEFAKEFMRFDDLIRWKLSEVIMTRKNYGILYPATDCLAKVVKTGDWFWPFAPDIDENGLPDFSKLESTGKIRVISQRRWDNRQYLWPIPTSEILINKNMTQNAGY